MSEPTSRNVCRVESRDYRITAAEWNNGLFDGCGGSYEIGIREKDGPQFWLVQNAWTEAGAQVAAKAVAAMLDEIGRAHV